MKPFLQKLMDVVFSSKESPRVVPRGLIDSLLQTFENRRPGLSDEMIHGEKEDVAKFFLDIYKKEKERLFHTVCLQESFLSDKSREKFFQEVDTLICTVVIPAYVRTAILYTPRERNQFYLVPEHYHFIERFGCTLAGMLLGGFIVWAPFIPLWSKEWILPFTILGLFFPNLRKAYSIKSYEAEVNRTVTKAEHEIDRIEMEYTSEQLTSLPSPALEDEMNATLEAEDQSREQPEQMKLKGGN